MSMEQYHGTTIISIRRQTPQGIEVALGGDGQVTLGNVVVKHSARKVRKLFKDQVLAGFAEIGRASCRERVSSPV